MYGRFTEKAQKAIIFSNMAIELDIIMSDGAPSSGLVKEGSGVAARFCKARALLKRKL